MFVLGAVIQFLNRRVMGDFMLLKKKYRSDYIKFHFCLLMKPDCYEFIDLTGFTDDPPPQEGFLHSENFPNPYPDNQHCEYVLHANPEHRIILYFDEFELEPGPNCEADYVKVKSQYFIHFPPAHKSLVATAVVHDCGFQMVDHPPYSPDVAPSDYFLFPNMKQSHCPGETGLPSSGFAGHSWNVSSTTFQSPELLIQCGFIWKETMQLVSWKVEFNACQVSLLWHNSLVSLWTFQPTLIIGLLSFRNFFVDMSGPIFPDSQQLSTK